MNVTEISLTVTKEDYRSNPRAFAALVKAHHLLRCRQDITIDIRTDTREDALSADDGIEIPSDLDELVSPSDEGCVYGTPYDLSLAEEIDSYIDPTTGIPYDWFDRD